MIRPAKETDLEAINEIYNHAVEEKYCTAHTEKVSMAYRREWFTLHDPGHYPVFVWDDGGRIRAWISLSPYRQGRMALRYTAEVSYYVHPGFRRGGLARKLMEHVIAVAPDYGFKTLIAILLEPNRASIGLLEKSGFRRWGLMPRAADFEGQEVGHLYYGLRVA